MTPEFRIRSDYIRNAVAQKWGGDFNKVNISTVSRESGLSRPAVLKWLNCTAMQAIDAKTLAAWCVYLRCDMSDIIEFRK